MRESSVPASDRRQTPRTKLAEIAYIGMGPENGGLVLDVSDGGLSFHSVAPVQPAEKIRFLLSLHGHSRIEGTGEVVWTNEMRTVCGMKFTSLSSGAREYLNNLTNQSRTSAPAREMDLSPPPPAAPATRETPQATEPPASFASQSETNAGPLFAIPPADALYLSEPTGRTPWAGQLFLLVVLGFLGATLIGSAYLYGVHVGQSEVSTMARPEAHSEAQTERPPLVPAPVPAPAVESEAPPAPAAATSAPSGATSIPNAAASAPGGGLVNTSKTGDASANPSQSVGAEGHPAAAPDQRAEQAAEAGKGQLAAALADLNGVNGPRDSSKAAKQLWAAVGNGNADAEVILADLYLKGDGVAKSCEQGRVLLIAAVRSGNAKARVKLDELNANGCP